MTKCELCNNQNLDLLHKYKNKYKNKTYNRVYYLCYVCKLIFLDKNLRLDLDTEKQRYNQHNNQSQDIKYLQFLDKLLKILTPYLLKTDKGLDYGCGPSVVLASYLSKQGFLTKHYDPLFFPQVLNLKTQYNFITCTEVAEHFYKVLKDFKKINSLLKKNGHLGLMTKLYTDTKDFPNWHYHKDMTHVSFYSKETMEWIAKYFNWKIIFLSQQVIIFKKQN